MTLNRRRGERQVKAMSVKQKTACRNKSTVEPDKVNAAIYLDRCGTGEKNIDLFESRAGLLIQ